MAKGWQSDREARILIDPTFAERIAGKICPMLLDV
jgi:hypothetical protein